MQNRSAFLLFDVWLRGARMFATASACLLLNYDVITRACVASQAVGREATDKAHLRLRAAHCHINPRQSKVLERLLEAGHVGSGGGFVGGMTNEKYAKITGISKATATRDLADLLAHGLLRVEGVGKATRYAVNVPGWEQPALKP